MAEAVEIGNTLESCGAQLEDTLLAQTGNSPMAPAEQKTKHRKTNDLFLYGPSIKFLLGINRGVMKIWDLGYRGCRGPYSTLVLETGKTMTSLHIPPSFTSKLEFRFSFRD